MAMEINRERDQVPNSSERTTMDNLRLGAAAVLGLLLALFVLMNTDKTRVDFVVTDVRMPLIFVLIGTAAVGAATSHLGLYVWRRRRRVDRE